MREFINVYLSHWLSRCAPMRLALFLVTLLGVCPTCGNSAEDAAGDNQSISSRFQSEAPSSWEMLERAARSLQVECTEVATTRRDAKPGEEKVARKRLVFKARPGCLLSDRTRLDESNIDVASAAEVLNDDYAFTVTRTGGSTWILRHAGAGDKDAVAHKVDTKTFICAHAPWVILEYGTLRSLWRSPQLKVTSVDRVVDRDQEFVRVEFSRSPGKDERNRLTLRKGWLLLDPKMYWCIREYVVSIASDRSASEVHGRITYNEASDPDKLPVPRHYNFTLINSQKKATVEYSYDYDKFEYFAPAVEDFRLTAYGLPEHVAIRGSRRSLRVAALVVFGAGLLCVAIAIYIRRGRGFSSDVG